MKLRYSCTTSNKSSIIWRNRWRKNKQQVPQFWLEFYKQKFEEAIGVSQLYSWGQIVGLIKFGLSLGILQQLRHFYSTSKTELANLSLIAA